jgi:hypothetical protein
MDSFPSIELRNCLTAYRYPTAAQCRGGTAAARMVLHTVARMARTASVCMADTAVCMDDTVGDTGDTVGDTADGMPAGGTADGMPAGDTADGMPVDGMAAGVDDMVAGVDDTPVPDGTAVDADDMELPLVRLLSGLSCLSKLERLGSA